MSGEDENRRKSRIGFHDETGRWYGLDNAATIMPAVSRGVTTYLFRLSATLDEAVYLPALQEALERTARRFSYFAVELREGFFWNYLEPHAAAPRVIADDPSPCQGFEMHAKGSCLFRVRARGRRVACEFAHILTDGTGGLRFLKNLLVEYFRLVDQVRCARASSGEPSPPGDEDDPDIYDLDAEADPEEYEDAYNRYYPGTYPHPDPERPAFRVEAPRLQAGDYRVICGILPLRETLGLAKSYGASLTEFLTAVHFAALQDIWFAAPEKERRRQRPRLAIEVPVNMRKFHATATSRNFSLFVHPAMDMRLGVRNFADIVTRVHHQLRYEIDGPSMARHISRNVSGGRLIVIRLVPLFLKYPLLRFLFSLYGDNIVSGVMSNLGPVSLPGRIAARVERFDFIPAPSGVIATKASVVSWRDSLYINFGSLSTSRELERLFFTRLRKLGLRPRVECNL